MAILVGGALERAAFPEQAGVSSAKLQAYIDDALANGIELHSLMAVRHGKVAAEVWRKPYGPQYPHIMFSVSKTITAIAIGLAIEEGFFSIDSRVIDFFPEFKPKKTEERLEKLTVFHLLTMTAGKDPLVFDSKAQIDWLEQFFHAKWSFTPGESWKYISENQYVLIEILRRATGQTATQFLTPRFYEPLQFGRVPVWETSVTGTEAGGWGMFLTNEEMAKIAQCLLDNGKWDGRQLIPEDWAVKMQSALVDNTPTNERWPDQCNGYGYCMWQNPVPNSSRLDGMFGQFAIIFRDFDAIVTFTSNEIDEMKARAFIWKHFPGVFCDESVSKPANSKALFMPEISPPISKPRSAETEQSAAGKTYKLKRPVINNLVGMPMSVATLPILQMSAYKHGNITNVGFEFAENTCTFKWTEDFNNGPVENIVICGMDGNARQSPATIANVPYTMNAWAFWVAEDTLEIHLRPLESLNDRIFSFRFRGNKITMTPAMDPDIGTLLEQMIDIYMGPFMPMAPVTQPLFKALSPVLTPMIEPTLSGKALNN